MLRGRRADGGSIAGASALPISSVGLPCVGAPERPRDSAFGDEPDGCPATLRELMQPTFVPVSLLPHIRDGLITCLARSGAFVPITLVKLRRALAANDRPPLVLRLREGKGGSRWFVGA